MKKISTLAFLALSAVGSIYAENYYIIKDGVLNSQIVQSEPEDPSSADAIVSGETYNGATVASYTHRAQWSEVRLDMSAAPLSPNAAWVLNIEYAIPAAKDEDSETYAIYDAEDYSLGKKPLFIFGLQSEVDYTKGAEDCDARVTVSGYEARESGDQFITRKVEMFSNPTIDSMRFMVFSYLREIGSELEPAYIKNMYFSAEGNKPFYAEDFTTVGAAIYQDNTSKLTLYQPELFHGNIVPSPIDETVKKMNIVRLWDAPYDASGIYDCEIYHALVNGFQIKDIAIPADVKEFSFDALMKYRWSEANQAIVDGGAELPKYPVTLTFDNGDVVNLTDTATVQAQWSWVKSIVTVPAGAKSATIAFNYIDDNFTYVIDQVKLTNTAATGVKEAAAATASVSIYPNPAVETVSTDADATKIEVLSLQGVVVASANGNSVNVASLAANVYIAKVYTAEGVAQALFIKK